jgi:hypothetical protein
MTPSGARTAATPLLPPGMPNGPSIGGIGGGMTGIRLPAGDRATIGVGGGSGAVGGRGPIGGASFRVKLKKGGAVKPIWEKDRPEDLGKPKPLAVKRKAAAKAKAKAAGRPYPNMVDNLAAARTKGK